MFGKGSLYHCVKIGARLSWLETLCIYALPLVFVNSRFRSWFLWNAACQLALFLPVVQLPAFLTGHMSYVDIGWPWGLVVLALNALWYGEGYYLRRWLTSGCLLLHGSRMGLGALVLFFPYRWKEDLPRYRYARVRFEGCDGMPARLWPLKVQHDTLQQAFATAVFIACPVMLSTFDETPSLGPLEVLGWALWGLSFLWENAADSQKLLFLERCRRQQLKGAVLGHPPFDSEHFRLWTFCRHPNYFGEWMCWNAFILMGVPGALRSGERFVTKLGFVLTFWLMTRATYDCLNYWTGAEPAEYYSLQKRALYSEYQASTRVFFPVHVPFVDHRMEPGWPHPPA